MLAATLCLPPRCYTTRSENAVRSYMSSAATSSTARCAAIVCAGTRCVPKPNGGHAIAYLCDVLSGPAYAQAQRARDLPKFEQAVQRLVSEKAQEQQQLAATVAQLNRSLQQERAALHAAHLSARSKIRVTVI